MLQSFLSRLGRWNELPSSFEFTVCDEVALPFALPCTFLLFNCRRKSDDMLASVFVLYKKQPSSTSSSACACNSTGGCCSNCAPSGATSAAHRQPTAIAAALAAGMDVVQQGRQHMKRAKTLLHPDMLKVLQTHESDAAIYIVTERCWPLALLPEWTAEEPNTGTRKGGDRRQHQHESARKTHATSLREYNGGPGVGTEHHEKATTREKMSAEAATAELEATVAAAAKADVAWGLLQIANAVAFLQDSCQLVHGQVNPLSIFVTADGSWKLSALELVRPLQSNEKNEGASAICNALSRQEQGLQQLLADQRRSAAYLQGWQPPEPLHSLPLQWTDWWGLASVVIWSYTKLLGRETNGDREGDGVKPLISRSTDNPYSFSGNSHSSSSYSSSRLGSSRGYEKQLFELSSATVRDTAPSVPPAARQFLKQLLSPVFQPLQGQQQQPHRNGRQLMRLSDVVKQTPFFSVNSTCNCMQFLREVHVKGAYEKEVFFEQVLPRQLQQPHHENRQAEEQQGHLPPQTLPLAVQQQQVLPELMKLLDPTTCATSGSTSCGGPVLECVSSSLTPAIVACVALIAASMKSDELPPASRCNRKTAAAAHLQVQRLRVVLEKLFKSSDRALRYTLLTSLDDFEPLLTRELCERTFNNMLLGLVDSTPVIREATVKALVVFCQKIATTKVLQTCLEQLRRLTEDPEAVLRTNACICAAKICSLQETVSLVSRSERLQEMLAQVLLAAMRDTFPLCRVASLQSVEHALSAFRLQAAMLTLSPAVAAAAVDPELSVAEAAVQALQKLVSVAVTATAERRAAVCTAEAVSAAGGAAKSDGHVSVSQQQAGGSNSSTLTKAAASLPNPAAVNFGNGGWFGIVARSLRNSLGVAGVLSGNSCSELLATVTTGPADSYTVTSSYGTSTTTSTYDTVSSSSTTRSMPCSVNVPPPPPPDAGCRRGPTTSAETLGSAPCPGRSTSNSMAPAAEKRRDNLLDAWEVTEAPADSVWDANCSDAWQDVGEPAGAGLRKDSVSSGRASYSGRASASRQQDRSTVPRDVGSITSSLKSATSASSALSAPAAAFGNAPASPAAALDGCRGVNLSASQGLEKSSSLESGLFSSTSSAAAGKPAAATVYTVDTSGSSVPTTSGTTREAAGAVDDFFAEMERKLREQNY